MNLDELKISLNNKLEGSENSELVLDSVFQKNRPTTNSILKKITKSLFIEIVLGLICIVLFASISFFSNYTSIKIYFGIFSVLIASITLVLYYLFKRTKEIAITTLPVINNLKVLHKLLSEFVKRYIQFTMLLIPICLVFSSYLGYLDSKSSLDPHSFFPAYITSKRQLAFLIIFIVLFTVSVYYFTKWYLKKLYGNHLVDLKKMIDQLDY